jgi:hypothetical protein
MTSSQSLGNQKSTRTQITNLPEIAVELSEREMRIVSGGLTSNVRGCSPIAFPPLAPINSVGRKTPTNTNNGGDHDSDWA